MSFNIYLASPRWYCAWVDRAIQILDGALKKYGSPIYVNHEIIHNKYIVNFFEKRGAIFEENLDNIPKGSIIIFSAHGVWPDFRAEVKERWLKYIDATCPLVTKVHTEAKHFVKDGYEIIYIGKKNHQEAIWVKNENPNKTYVVYNKDDVDNLSWLEWKKLALLTQTTLSVDDTTALIEYIKELYPDIDLPRAKDICYATTNRQAAVKEMTQYIDTLLIVGSESSSNSNKLRDIGEKKWINSYLIDTFEDIDESIFDNLENIWVSSWASGPEKLVQEVLEYLKSKGWIMKDELKTIEENMVFAYNLELK